MTTESNEPTDQETPNNDASERGLLDYPDLRKTIADAIPRLIEILETRSTQSHKRHIASRIAASVGLVGVLGVATGYVFWLAANGKLSSDATAFLFGVVISGLFAFFERLIPD